MVKFILYIYIVHFCLNFVLKIVVYEIVSFILKLRRYAQYMQVIGKIFLCDNNLAVINTKTILIFHGI